MWSAAVRAPLRPATRVKLSAAKLRSTLLSDDTCGVVLYEQPATGGGLVGQAFCCTFATPELGDVRCITQLVVAKRHRRQGIAETLLRVAMCRSNVHPLFAAALVSSNPFTIRALQRACGSAVSAHNNVWYARLIHSSCTVPYVRAARLDVDETRCVVDTLFQVDHIEVQAWLC